MRGGRHYRRGDGNGIRTDDRRRGANLNNRLFIIGEENDQGGNQKPPRGGVDSRAAGQKGSVEEGGTKNTVGGGIDFRTKVSRASENIRGRDRIDNI